MKKKLVVLLLTVCVLLSLVACSSVQQPQSSSKGDSVEGSQAAPTTASIGEESQKTLRFCWWGSDARHEATLAVGDLYEKQNPNVTVQGEFIGWDGYVERLITQLAAKTAPEIMQVDSAWVLQFWGMVDRFVDLNKQDIMDMSVFSANKGMLDIYTAPGGQLIGVPTGLNFSVLYANKNLADEIGLDLTQHFTWDKIEADGRRVQEYNSEMYLLGSVFPNYEHQFFNTYLLNQCGDYMVRDDYTLGFDYDDALATFTWFDEMYKEGVIQPMEDVMMVGAMWENPGWLANEVVLIQDFSSQIGSRDMTNVIPLPAMGNPDADNTGVVLRPTNILCLAADSQYSDEALRFLDFFYNDDEAIDTLGIVRSVPVTPKALNRMKELDILTSEIVDLVSWTQENKGGQGINVISASSEFAIVISDMLNKVYYGDHTPEGAANEFIRLMEQKTAELKSMQ